MDILLLPTEATFFGFMFVSTVVKYLPKDRELPLSSVLQMPEEEDHCDILYLLVLTYCWLTTELGLGGYVWLGVGTYLVFFYLAFSRRK